MKRLGDDLEVVKPAAKRICYLQPTLPVLDATISPLYYVLVPHENPHGLDVAMVLDVAVHLEIDSAKWNCDATACEEIGRWIDTMQLALTCKHASRYINVSLVRDNMRKTFHIAHHTLMQIMSIIPMMLGMFDARSRMGYNGRQAPEISERWGRRVYAATVSAFVGRENVSRLVAPRDLILNVKLVRFLAPGAGPRKQDYPTYSSLREEPFIWFIGETRTTVTDAQYYMWLAAAVMYGLDVTSDVLSAAAKCALFYRSMRRSGPNNRANPCYNRMYHLLDSTAQLGGDERHSILTKAAASIT